MCTILVAWRCLPGVPAVVAANRDEAIGRPTAPPGVLVEHPRVVGGRDLLAGGTWLAVAADGRLAAVTNRHAEWRDPSLRSRGELPLALLAAADPGRALEAVDAPAYNPFNALVVTRDRAVVGQGDGGDRLRVVDLEPGPHVLTVHDLDDASHVKVAFLAGALTAAVERSRDMPTLLAAMEQVLADHGGAGRDGVDAACVHGEGYGTVSSSSVVLADDTTTYRHAPGRPCVTPREDVSALLR